MIAIVCGGAVFLFSPSLRRFHKFIGFTFIFEGMVALMAGVVLAGMGFFSMPFYLLYVTMLLVAPLFYYLAVRSLLGECEFRSRDFWMLLTALVFVALTVPVASVIPPADKDLFFRLSYGMPGRPTTGALVLGALDSASFALFLAEYLFIQIFCIISLPKYQRLLSDYYSNLEGLSLPTVVAVLVLMALRFLCLAAMGFLPDTQWISVVYAVAFSLFYIASTICVCRVGYTAEELGRMCRAQESRNQEPVANDAIKSRMDRLLEERFFLDPDTNLMDVAGVVHVNSKYLAEYLKYHYGETFLTYVNRLRVEHATVLLGEGRLSMEDIAEQSGYTNVSTFYRNFIKVKGVSPSKFKKI
ncbi:MAG: helix-turn-helix domain-containing protein [Bacteroidales bacterium]|nr:helix-turn-helix domain-containing protein [Bacteroidales bacterium]